MNINRRGVTRIVVEFNSVVIKIPNFTYSWNHFLKGLIGNMEEGKTWKWNSGKYEKGFSYLLCPVLWFSWGGWILIMRKVDETVNENNYHIWNCEEHKKHFKGDDTAGNYGFLNGKLVKLDYADLDDNWGSDFKP